ncbi:MAG: FtsX-like permease family protein [Verrucomicrobiae bacterium]|nr:FtsX-like permease family protein [Verrucomicrobiae bacterium]
MRACLSALALLAAFAMAARAAEGLDPSRFAGNVATLTRAPHRLAGTPEGRAAGDFIERELRKMKGEVFVQRFTFPQQQLRECFVEFDGKRLPLLPLSANGLQASVTPAAGIEGPLVDIGDGSDEALEGRDLRGTIALARFASRGALRRAFGLGARAIVFLGDVGDDRFSLQDKRSYVSVDLPRFYMPLDTARREGLLAAPRGRVVSRVEWTKSSGRNFFLWIPGVAPAFREGKTEYMILSAPYDSEGIVPWQSPSPGPAANAAALLEVARRYAAAPPRRSVLVAFFDNHANFLEGGRQFYAAFRRSFPILIKDPLPVRKRFVAEERETLRELGAQLRAPDPFRKEGRYSDRGFQLLRDAARSRYGDCQLALVNLRLEQERNRKEGRPPDPSLDRQIASLLAEHQEFLVAREVVRDRRLPLESARAGFERVRKEVLERLQSRLAELDELDAFLDDALALTGRLAGKHPVMHASFRFTGGNTMWLAVPPQSHSHEKLFADLAAAGTRAVAASGVIWPTEKQERNWWNWPTVEESDLATAFEIPCMILATASDRAEQAYMPRPAVDAAWLDAVRQQAADSLTVLDLLANQEWASVPNRIATVTHRLILLDDYQWDAHVAEPEGHMVKGYTFGQNAPNRPEPHVLVHIVPNDIRALQSQVIAGPETYEAIAQKKDFYVWTDANGCFPWIGVHSAFGTRGLLEAARFDEDGRIESMTTANPKGGSGTLNTGWEKASFHNSHAQTDSYVILPMFHSQSGRFLGKTLPFGEGFRPSGFSLLNGLTDSAYRRFHLRYDPFCGVGAFYVEKPMGIKILYQDQLNRENVAMLINCPPGASKGIGFEPGNGQPPGPRPPTRNLRDDAASDFVNLDETRLNRLRQRNIILNSLESLHARATGALGQARLAASAFRHAMAEGGFSLAVALERHVYHPVITTTNDMVVAVTFLLVLAIPFSLGVQSLLFATYSVYRKIAAFALVFAATFVVLYFVHPAFAFAATPMIIILAFVVMVMSGGVIWLIGNKFVYEVNKMQGLATAAHALRRGAVGNLGAALSLAISTMRRRPVRTLLTTATVLLLTFTILSFVSVQTEDGISRHPIGVGDAATRLLVHRKVWRSMDRNVLAEMRRLVGPRGDVRGRFWLTEEIDLDVSVKGQSSNLRLAIPLLGPDGTRAQASALLTLDSRELELLPALREGLSGRVAEFAEGKGIYLSPAVARQLSVREGDPVRLRGLRFTVLGTFDPSKIAALRDLDGARLLPVNFVATQQAMRFSNKGSAGGGIEASTDQQSDLEDALAHLEPQALEAVDPENVVLVPTQSESALGMSLKCLTVYPAAGTDLEKLATDLALVNETGAYLNQGGETTLFFYGKKYGVSGTADVLIPLLLGGLIIFSTMLGSVIDREKEIYTFSALGLAPKTIAALFFVEAGVYAVIGGFGGYLLSQVVTRLLEVLAAWGLFRAPEMNYSSSTAIYTILLVMATVMVSTIYPALQAARKATADTRRAWRPPRPEDDTCRFEFPFTISRHDIGGIVCFIREHFATHADRTVGRFAVDAPRIFLESRHGMPGLSAAIWLQPFDQGISQGFELTARPSEIEEVCEIHVELTRRSGPPTAWERAYRVFLGDMRLQFLLWRTLPDDVRNHYLAEADSLEATLRT